MKAEELCYLSIARLSKLIREKEVSPVEVVEAHLSRIEEVDGKLNSFITLMKDEALDSARQAEKSIQSGRYLGPLHGIPIGLKDLYYTKGVKTTGGSKILADFVPDHDAAVVEKFHEAGAIIIGKLQMHEFAYGPTSENPHYGPARNPWNTEHITGGSSGGSGAAVATGLCAGALGSDTGGSIRIPAALCGITGLKPTYGRVSRYGVLPLSWSLDTVGPMTRSAEDAALVLNAIAGYDERDPASANEPVPDFTASMDEGARGLRVGVPKEYFFDVIDPEVREAVDRATTVLEELGASVEEVSLPVLNYSAAISSPILGAEAAAFHQPYLSSRLDDYSPETRARLEVAALTRAVDYVKAQRARSYFNHEVAQVMKRVDLLVAPTCPLGATQIGQRTAQVGETSDTVMGFLTRLTRPFNITGTPAISVPCGFTSAGLPIGFQIAGRPFEEATVTRAAHAYQTATDWHTRRPTV